ncbi:MAG: GNAT family N-acetyltransferase [Candidatus Bathyarchaeota archaeon]|nr:MAG: GNAT family N-acetyltransferase [Candidatus Bathyarchaeota archaeon]
MEFLTYKELPSKDELLPLFQHAFWWPFNPEEFEKEIRTDPRLKSSPVGFAALKSGRLAGFVGVVDIPTRTLQGSVEKVGGIWGVVTHPAHARRGICTALMEKSHNYFKEQDYRFSLLYTSRILIAHALYQKLGYKDTLAHSSVYKIMRGREKPSKKRTGKAKIDWKKILELYNQAVKDCTGFVVRDMQYGKGLEARKKFTPEKTILRDQGYALLKESDGNVNVRELITLKIEETSEIITQIEKEATKTVIAENVMDGTLLRAYRSHGYITLKNGYDLLMSKQLADATFEETYGSQFFATSTDFF